MDFSSFHADFLSIEEELKLFNWQINGQIIWEYLRIEVFNQIKQEVFNYESPQTRYIDLFGVWNKVYVELILNSLVKNPFFSSKKCEILVFGHNRRKLFDDGKYWDIYTDFFCESLNYKTLHLENPYYGFHLRPVKTKNLKYLDYFGPIMVLGRYLNKSKISGSDLDKIKLINSEFNERFNLEIDLKGKIIRILKYIQTYELVNNKLLDRLKPKMVVEVVGYDLDRMVLNALCKQRNIPTIEIQHGMISKFSLAYANHKFKQSPKTFPDYVFVWGEYFKKTVNYPIPRENIIVTGFPYFEKQYNEYRENKRQNRIIFISQWTIGKELSELAVDLSKKIKGYEILYKLHPGEYRDWEVRYPWLKKSDLSIIDNDKLSLYELLSSSQIQVGVYSTSLYEGLAFNLQTFIPNIPGWEHMKPLIEDNLAIKVDTSDDIIEKIDYKTQKMDKSYYFKNDSVENIIQSIKMIIDRS